MRLFAGHFYLTKLLLPVLKATAKNSPAGTVRVVNMSSIAHYMSASEGIRWSTLGPGTEAAAARKKLGMARLYGQSKLVKLHNSYVDGWRFLICGKGQYSVFERTRSTIWRRWDCVHLPVPRRRQRRSLGLRRLVLEASQGTAWNVYLFHTIRWRFRSPHGRPSPRRTPQRARNSFRGPIFCTSCATSCSSEFRNFQRP
jgi:hypothetical protein